MLRQTSLGLVIWLVVAAAPALGQEVKLAMKFKEGDKFWVEDVVNSKINMSVAGLAVEKSEQKSTQITSYTVKKVAADGIVMDMRIEDADIRSEGGIGGQLGGVLNRTKGASFIVTVTPNGKVKKFEGLDAFLKKFDDDPDSKLIKESLNEEMFTKAIEQAFAFLPDKGVKKGDTWDRDTKYPLGPLGHLNSKNTYTYNGKGDVGEEIGVTSNLDYKAPKDAAFGGLFKVVKGDLKSDRAKSTYVFDNTKGRLVSVTSSLRIQGSLTVEASGQQLQMDLSVDESATSKVHDKNPAKN